MMDEKITLDRKSFEALVSESRGAIMKSLAERRKTLTELAAQAGLSPSTVKEHMLVLEKAGLVEMKDEGRKWKYYELTWKGKNIVQPRELKIWIVLGVSGVAVAGALFGIISKLGAQAGQVQALGVEGARMTADAGSGALKQSVQENFIDGAVASAPAAAMPPVPQADAFVAPALEAANQAAQPLLNGIAPELALLVVGAIVFGAALAYSFRK